MDNNSISQANLSNDSPQMVQDVVTGLTNDQCQQIIALLSGKLSSVNTVSTSHSIQTGNHYIMILNSGYFQSNVWILDSGATRHVCNNKELFTNIKDITNTRIRLPNHSLIPANQMGDIKINEHFFA